MKGQNSEGNTSELKLLLIGQKEWCQSLLRTLGSGFKTQYIYEYEKAMQRLKHNSYDVLVVQQSYFRYKSIQFSQLSYAMSRPSVIVCSSLYHYILYSILNRVGAFTKSFKFSRDMIYIKYQKKFIGIQKYIKSIPKKNDMIQLISKQLRDKTSFDEQ